MTATRTAPGRVPAAARLGRRWLRLVLPMGLAVALIGWTVLAHLIGEPSRTDSDYLNPASTAGIGARTLADQLTTAGIRIQVAHSGTEAVDLAVAGDTTLLLPATDLMLPDAVFFLRRLPATVTVVLVRPARLTLAEVHAPIDRSGTRWASRPASGCPSPGGLPTGQALVYHDHYALVGGAGNADSDTLTRDCFDHALVGFQPPGLAEFILVGADDIFRNDRVGELGNAALAGALLGGHPALVWLDLHHQEHTPRVRTSRPPPSGGGSDGDDDQSGPSLPLPSWVKATAVGLLAAAVIAALAAGRRLGGPVQEPLPVRVRATETAIGRGRLYRRARARGVALSILRDHAVQRLRSALDLPGAPPATLVPVLAQRLGTTPEAVHTVLFGPEPPDDEALTAAVADLDALLTAALPEPSPTPASTSTSSTKEWS